MTLACSAAVRVVLVTLALDSFACVRISSMTLRAPAGTGRPVSVGAANANPVKVATAIRPSSERMLVRFNEKPSCLVPSSLVGGAGRMFASLVAWSLSRAGMVDPIGVALAHVHVHEAGVRVIADADVVQAANEVAQRFVRHSRDAEVERASGFVS